MKKGKGYEQLIAKIYKELSPDAAVTLNDKIKGLVSGIDREIDVTIRSSIAGHDILIAVQAKDYGKKPADVNVVGTFKAVLDDIKASKGILICTSGFSKKASQYAANCAIDLCTAHDAETRNWKLDLKIPFLAIQLEESFVVTVGISANKELIELNKRDIQVPMDIRAALSFDKGKNVFTGVDLIKEIKDSGKFPKKAGMHQINLFKPGMEILIETVYAPLNKLIVNCTICKKGYFKYVDPVNYRGIRNLSTNNFDYTDLSLEALIPTDNIFDDSWEIVDPDAVPITPLTLSVEISSPFESQNLKQIPGDIKILKKS